MKNDDFGETIPLEARYRWPVGLLAAAWLGLALLSQEPVPSGLWAYALLVAGLGWIGQAAFDFTFRRAAGGIGVLLLVSTGGLVALGLPFWALGPLLAGGLLLPRRAVLWAGGLALLPLLYSVWAGYVAREGMILLLGGAHLAVAYYLKKELDRGRAENRTQHRKQEVSEEKLQNQNMHLENLGRMTSHNLRAPLQGIKMLTEMIHQVPAEERRELTDKIDEGVDEMLTMVRQLSEMLKQHAEAQEQTEEIWLAEVWDKTQSQLQGLIASTQAELEADFSDCEVVRYPRIYLESIFLNLCSNALKYRKENEPARLRVESYRDNGQVLLSFRDEGRGINLEQEGRQLFKWHRPGAGGESQSGMGLFMTKNQVEMLGGKIMVESEPGEGSTFTVMLYQL